MDNLGAQISENLPKLGDEQIDRYVIRQVDVLARHFSKEQTIEGAGQAAQPGLVDYDMAVGEWILLRSLMSTAQRGMNCEQFVSSLFAKHANVFPALCVVASAAAALPVTNASPERGFSTPIANRILTKLRNRLLEGTLDQLMRISIECPLSSQMDYCKAPLICTYVFSGLATEQVLNFGGVLTFGGMIRRSEKILQVLRSLFNPVISAHNTLLYMFQRLCTYFQDRGVLIIGVCTFGALQPTAIFSKSWRGTSFRKGIYLRGFTVSQGFAAVAISPNPPHFMSWTSALTENCPLRLSAYV